jgi:hypothetical protein
MSGSDPPAPPLLELADVVLLLAGAAPLPPWLPLVGLVSDPRALPGGLLALHALLDTTAKHASAKHE